MPARPARSVRLGVEALETRDNPVTTNVEVYAWNTINLVRANPVGFAVQANVMFTNTFVGLFQYAASDPVLTDLRNLYAGTANFSAYQAAYTLMTKQKPLGPLGWQSRLETISDTHNTYMQSHALVKSWVGTGTPPAVQAYLTGSGFTQQNPLTDYDILTTTQLNQGFNPAWSTGSWEQNVAAYQNNYLANTRATYGAGSTAYRQRQAFAAVVLGFTELRSAGLPDPLARVKNLLARDSTAVLPADPDGIPQFNAVGVDLDFFDGNYSGTNTVQLATFTFSRHTDPEGDGGGYINQLVYSDVNGNGYYDVGEGAGGTSGLAFEDSYIYGDAPNGTSVWQVNDRTLARRRYTVARNNAYLETRLSPNFGATPTLTTDLYDAASPNNTADTATDLGTVGIGNRAFAGRTDALSVDTSFSDYDYFKFTVPAGQGYALDAYLGFDVTNGPIYASLYRQEQFGTNYLQGFGGSGSDLRVARLLGEGTYYLSVYGYANFYSLTLGGKTFQTRWQAETQLSHQVGRLDTGSWSANTAQDPAGYLAYGPYTTALPAGTYKAAFALSADNTTASNVPVATVEVHDATTNQIIARRVVRRHEFPSPNTYQDFELTFANPGGNQLQFRVYYWDSSYLKFDQVNITPVQPGEDLLTVFYGGFTNTFEAETAFTHSVGRREFNGWAARPGTDAAGYLLTGPLTYDVPPGQAKAAFRLAIDTPTGPNDVVAVVEVINSAGNEQLARRVVRRAEFQAGYQYQDFPLLFSYASTDATTRGKLEFRVTYTGAAYLAADAVAVSHPYAYRGGPAFNHQTGQAAGTAWEGLPGQHAPGFLAYGPYVTAVPAGTAVAQFNLQVPTLSTNDVVLAVLDVHDATTGTQLAVREVKWREFTFAGSPQYFTLYFSAPAGNRLQFRVNWPGIAAVRLNEVFVYPSGEFPPTTATTTYQAEGNAYHQVGRLDGTGWAARTGLDAAPGYLQYGPYQPAPGGGGGSTTNTAVFRLQIDEVDAANSLIATLDVRGANGRLLASRQLRRADFNGNYQYQDFALSFNANAAEQLQYRVYWHRASYLRLDHVRVY